MEKLELATLAGGCFWCTEAIFQRLKGVKKVTSGYSGGNMKNPSYQKVSSGQTGHAEAIQITFNPSIILFERLLEVFFATHNPTTLNRQGSDEGSQYRSVIFYHGEEQKRKAQDMTNKLQNSGRYKKKIVTELIPFKNFYRAEDYHQNYYNFNKDKPYCQLIIDPKVDKLLKEFSKEVKEEFK